MHIRGHLSPPMHFRFQTFKKHCLGHPEYIYGFDFHHCPSILFLSQDVEKCGGNID